MGKRGVSLSDSLHRYAAIALRASRTAEPHYEDPLLHSAHAGVPLRELTPSFWGCFDWHSAVHSHWTMLRILGLGVSPELDAELAAALDFALDPSRIEIEARSIEGAPGFETPYGLAWVLTLDAEVHRSARAEAPGWSAALEPLTRLAARRLGEWLDELQQPDEVGLHRNTAFSLGLMHDWAAVNEDGLTEMIRESALAWWGQPGARSLLDEPGPHDFLSPALSAADLMRRLIEPEPFAGFLDDLLPSLGRDLARFVPVDCPDPSDGRLAHLEGLNLSRAWMLRTVADALPPDDERIPGLVGAADDHLFAGDAAVTGEHFAGAHWLPTFATLALASRHT